jgi:hypothetical protein
MEVNGDQLTVILQDPPVVLLFTVYKAPSSAPHLVLRKALCVRPGRDGHFGDLSMICLFKTHVAV